jgi:hypothetical protein
VTPRPLFPEFDTVLTANSAAISTVETTLATLSSFTVDGSTEVELAFSFYNFSATVVNDTFFLRMYDGATMLHQDLVVFAGASTGNSGGKTIRTRFTPSAGAHASVTVKYVRNGGSGTSTLSAGSASKAIFSVRQVVS